VPIACNSSIPIPRPPRRRGRESFVALEDAGFSVDSAAPGCAYFETHGVERLYGGLEPALKRALQAAGAGWDARVGGGVAEVHRAGCCERRALGAGAGRLRRADAGVPRTAADRPARARGAAAGGAEGAGGQEAWRACRPSGWRCGRTTGAGRPARLGPGERRLEAARARAQAPGGAGRVARVSGGGRQRAHAAALARDARRPAARPAGTRWAGPAQARACRAPGRRGLVAADGDASRRHRRSRPPPLCAGGRSCPSCLHPP